MSAQEITEIAYFPPLKSGIVSLKQHRGHIGNLRQLIYLLQR